MSVRNELLELDIFNLCVGCKCVHRYFVESILYVSSWYILVSRICSTRSLAQTRISKLFCLHYLLIVPVSSSIGRFFWGKGGGALGRVFLTKLLVSEQAFVIT